MTKPMKIKINLDDNETMAIWEAALKAKAEVDSWPAWKRGERQKERPSAPCHGEDE